MIARMLIKENLSIFSPTTMRLMDLWDREYSHELLVELPDPLNNTPVHFKSFVNAQKERIDKIKKLLCENWSANCLKIIEEGRTNSDLDKEQVPVFYEGIAVLMSKQLRTLITDSIDKFVNFFRKFKLDE